MNYRKVKRRVRRAAAEHLYSLEIYDEFDEADEDRVSRAIYEIQNELRGKTAIPCPDCGLYAGTHLSMCESEEANQE